MAQDDRNNIVSEFDVKSDNIRERHSTRNFKPDPILDEILKGIIDAGLLAPSSKNRQPWSILTLKGQDVNRLANTMYSAISDELSDTENAELKNDLRMALKTMDIIKSVPVLLVIGYSDRHPYSNAEMTKIGITDRKLVDIISIGACIENILLEASERGVCSLWIRDYLYAYDTLTDYLQPDFGIVSMVALGYPSDTEWTKSKRYNDRVSYR